MEKLSSILVPSIDTIAQPSHCILHAVTQDNITEITTESGFQHFSKNHNRHYSFYPVCNTNIRKGEILYFAHKGAIYTINRDLSKALYIRSQRHEMDDNTFWLGLDLNESIKDISGLSFYFDINGTYEKNKYLNLLSYTTWSIGEEKLSINKGLSHKEEYYENGTLDLFSGCNLSTQINQRIKEFYRIRYFSITGNCSIENKKEIFPKELLSSFPENSIAGIDKSLIWIKVTGSQRLTSDIINTLQPSINTFPVVNKELVSKIMELNSTMPVIPLNTKTNTSFISINKVTDSSGKKYFDVPLYNDTDNTYGIYSLRRGGVERYNRRDAGEYLAYIIEALSWEISSFFKDKDEVKADMKKIEEQVNKLIQQLKKKLAETKDRYEIENYLWLPLPDKAGEVYFVDYWTTSSRQANHIRQGSTFFSTADTITAYSLSQTMGGEYAPRASEKDNLYQKSMAEHSLLITDDDILDFCLKEFNESISEVKVCKGFMKSENPKFGFIETTDIHLKPLSAMKDYLNEKDKEYFHQSLKKKSPATYNYRIFIEDTL
ncbi:hypothetical protein [Dysgonomonas sp. 521]|uniref:hypothetical protein n=1 Tax=Dysgonomonas sp. 521 TaxID=2302932 RepID=UPI001C888D95|nr:hypothetical protein [Dysgonomonas sp. 521]